MQLQGVQALVHRSDHRIDSIRMKNLLVLFVIGLGLVVPAAYAQSEIVEISQCESRGLSCGREDAGLSQKYCCIEFNGHFPIHVCCNPHISLGIGLGVGIPLLAAVVIGLIVAFCACSRYHNHKMDRMMIAFRQAQLEEDEEEISPNQPPNPAAPPAYTPVALAEMNSPKAGLPVYTESDPFAPPVENVQPAQEESSTVELDDVALLPDHDVTESA